MSIKEIELNLENFPQRKPQSSLVNSTKHLRKNNTNSIQIFLENWRGENIPLLVLWGQHDLYTKTSKLHYKKTNIPQEHRKHIRS